MLSHNYRVYKKGRGGQMTEYKEMIEVLEGTEFTFDKGQTVGFMGIGIKNIVKALSKAITLAKAFDSVSDNLEMPEKRTYGNEAEWNVSVPIFNAALDLCKPLIVKRDMRIRELEKKVSDYNSKFLHQDRIIDELEKDIESGKR